MNQTLIIVGGIDTIKAATGVDMADIVKSNTIQAKTNRNFDVDIKK